MGTLAANSTIISRSPSKIGLSAEEVVAHIRKDWEAIALKMANNCSNGVLLESLENENTVAELYRLVEQLMDERDL
jgi:hypothetical protein